MNIDELKDELSFLLQYIDQIGLPKCIEEGNKRLYEKYRKIRKFGIPLWNVLEEFNKAEKEEFVFR